MSIVTQFKTTVANTAKKAAKKGMEAVKNAAEKVGDGIAAVSKLSPNQIAEIDKKRVEYLSAKPSMDDDQAQKFIENALGAIGIEVFQAYLPQLNERYLPVDVTGDKYDSQARISYFDVTKWVTDKEENSIDKLTNVYQVLSGENCNIALIYHKTVQNCKVILAISNTNDIADVQDSTSFCERLQNAVKGNFPGSVIGEEIQQGLPEVVSHDDSSYRVASVSNMAAEKSEKFISQSIEKLFDGVALKDNEKYTIVLLAEPIAEQIEERRARLYELYTALAPFSGWQTNYTYTESEVIGAQASAGVNAGIGIGQQQGSNMSSTEGSSHTDSSFSSKTHSDTVGVGVHGGVPVFGGSASYNHSYSRTAGTSIADTLSKSLSKGVSFATSAHFNFGVNFSRSSNVSMTVGKNEGITNNFTNYGVKNTLEIIEEQIKRLEQSAALGMWDFAAYIISNSNVVAENTANMYLSLTQGEKSFMTTAAVNVWDEEKSKVIMGSLKRLHHPLFGLRTVEADEQWLMYPTLVTAAAGVSGRELAYALNFPRKSVGGLPVLESVSFGREIHKYDKDSGGRKINLGKIYHMRKPENAEVSLDVNSLASHTFITGSTGSGKSNTIYQMLGKLKERNVNFLVIEPAKGEYKNVFGHDEKVSVYGTNPNFTKMLRINPFSFPEGIHVYEHLDRLVEIFNACWPMYAAMPAVLKDAVERAYIDCGWDMKLSQNSIRDGLFPTFADVLDKIGEVMEESKYSADSKGDYIGALSTRFRSMTTGINSMMFTQNELSYEELFDENAIVDISRIGSVETKALIMGILVMKQQEYRMSQASRGNEDLNHVTVLEEAHTLLKRTSTEQATESANLIGKSVEMIANAIAEMRTYGEGFIIADQSPGLLDMSVIRNTNTKIILRLPEYSDRELVGKAASLNDDQIVELAKLERGVAAVYQNDWIESVLCKVDKYGAVDEEQTWNPQKDEFTIDNADLTNEITDLILKHTPIKNRNEFIERLDKANMRSSVKKALLEYIGNGYDGEGFALSKISDKFFNSAEIMELIKTCKTVEDWQQAAIDNITPPIKNYSDTEVQQLLLLILQAEAHKSIENKNIFHSYMEYLQNGRRMI